MEILTAFLFVLALALIAGILLLIFSRLFFVAENPVKKNVRECLPGINCGACGYKGCDDYAQAIAEDGAKPNLCVPGTQKVADKICEIMGVEKEENEVKDVVAYVACNGHCEATKPAAIYEGVKTCRAASMLYGGTNSCRFGCLGYGDCAAVCPSGAICLEDGIARVDTSKCLGCRLCEQTCPKHVITMLPQEAPVAVMCSNKQKGADARKACTNACIACRKCEKNCPNGAISIKDNLAVVDYAKCRGCGLCTSECPTGCIKNVRFPDLPDDFDFESVADVEE